MKAFRKLEEAVVPPVEIVNLVRKITNPNINGWVY